MTEQEKLDRREARKLEREAAKQLAAIEAEKNQKPVRKVTFTIEWKKSKTWGSNPHLTADIHFVDGSYQVGNYSCSGCGYDKESTVIADAFNAVLKYKLWQIEDTKQELPYGIRLHNDGRYFSGGIGVNCYQRIAQFIGGEFTRIASGETFDVYQLTMGEQQ